MTRKFLTSFGLSLIAFTALGQMNIYASTGVGGNSGATVYPYEDPDPLVSFPWLLEVEVGHSPSSRLGISVFGQRKENAKGTFLSTGVDADVYYFGLKTNFVFYQHKKFDLIAAPYAAYGHERLQWKDSSFDLFSGGSSVEGTDQFHLLQIGMDVSAVISIDPMMFKMSVNLAEDTVLGAHREVSRSSAKYNELNYDGSGSLNFKIGFGVKIFGQ